MTLVYERDNGLFYRHLSFFFGIYTELLKTEKKPEASTIKAIETTIEDLLTVLVDQ